MNISLPEALNAFAAARVGSLLTTNVIGHCLPTMIGLGHSGALAGHG